MSFLVPGFVEGHIHVESTLLTIPEFLKRAELAEKYKKIADGHSPGLTGKMLNAYILAGAQTDHECTTAQEAKEKLKHGMHVHIREGSTEHNLLELIKIVYKKGVLK